MLSSYEGVWFISRLPWVVPSVALALIISVAASGLAARWLRVPRLVGWVILMSIGVILAGTLTPLGFEYRTEPRWAGTCDLSRIGPAGFGRLTAPSDVLLNILMFIPLGFAIAYAPRSRRKAAALVIAFASPVLIEVTQMKAAPLARGCQSADVFDNLSGLIVGLFVGAFASWLAPTVTRIASGESRA